jgi:ribosomal protein L24
MGSITLAVLLALTAQEAPKTQTKEAPKEGPRYRYIETPNGVYYEPGGTLWAHMNHSPYVPICTDIFALGELEKSILADDQAGIDELKRVGRMFTVPVGTAVKLIEYDKGGVFTKVQNYEVRVLEGNHQGKKGHIFSTYLKRRVEDIERPKQKTKSKPEPKPASVAASKLRLGKSLEEKRNPRAALSYYREVVEKFPGTAEAAEARKRIEAIESKPSESKKKSQ